MSQRVAERGPSDAGFAWPSRGAIDTVAAPLLGVGSARRLGAFCVTAAGVLLVGCLMGLPAWALAQSGTSAQQVSNPGAITQGPDGNVWFAQEGDRAGDTLGYVTANGQIRLFAVGEQIGPLTAGPDGAVWFSDGNLYDTSPTKNTDAVDRITSAGRVTSFAVSLPAHSVINGLTTGPDGNVWFTVGAPAIASSASAPAAIGRITPEGAVTLFSAGLPPDARPHEIVSGPGGALWFIDDAGRIGRVATDGTISEAAPGVSVRHSQGLSALAAGPDGNLWYTNGAVIARRTPGGLVTVFRTNLGGPGYITAGPDASLYFTRNDAHIGRITTAGAASKLPGTLSSSDTRGIATGADGDLWITEADLNTIARVTPTGQVREFPPPPGCQVPDVRGFHLPYASSLLAENACRPGALRRAHGIGPHRRGLVVVAERPSSGTHLPRNARVTLILAPRPKLSPGCRPDRFARLVTRSAQLIAWTDTYDGLDGEPQDTTTVVYACAPHARHHTAFAGNDTLLYASDASDFHYAGHFLGLVDTRVDHYNNFSVSLIVFDARRGRANVNVPVVYNGGDVGPGGSQAMLDSYALNPHGFLAYATTTDASATLVVRDSHGQRTIDRAATTAPRLPTRMVGITNLAFHGNTLTWSNNGQPKTATLS